MTWCSMTWHGVFLFLLAWAYYPSLSCPYHLLSLGVTFPGVCMYVWMDGCMDGCMYVCMYGCMDGCMYIHFSSISFPFHLFMLIFIFTSYLYASHPFHSHLISISTPHSTSLHSTSLPFTSPFTFTNIPKFTYTNPFNIHFILFSTFHSHIHFIHHLIQFILTHSIT